MKILLDTRLYGLEYAGIGRYLVHLVTELQKIDCKNNYTLLLRKKYYKSLILPKNWTPVLADFGVYGFSEQLKLPGIIRQINPDLSHFPHFNVPVFGHGKFVVTLHDMTMHKEGIGSSKLNHPFYYIKKMAYKLVFKMATYNSKSIIVPSMAVKRELETHFRLKKGKIMTTYEGFDKDTWNGEHKLDILEKGELSKGGYFIYVGSLYPHKNLKSLISALYLLNKHSGKKAHLAIVGARNLFLGKLEEYITEKKLEDYVSILGFVKDADTSALMKNSLGFIYPSLSEGFGLQGLEAMSSGALVLSSDIPVFKEIYASHAIYFDPLNPVDIAKKMEKVMRLEKRDREVRIKRARKFIEKYSWEKMAKETLKVYEAVFLR